MIHLDLEFHPYFEIVIYTSPPPWLQEGNKKTFVLLNIRCENFQGNIIFMLILIICWEPNEMILAMKTRQIRVCGMGKDLRGFLIFEAKCLVC